MKKTLLLATLVALLHTTLSAQLSPKREFRGAWVATYFGIDWPNRNHTPQQQRAAFLAIADHHKATGITAMFVQVRSQSDAMYPSELVPWSFYLTPAKTDGNEPSEPWDPLQFMIEACHERGIEFHAWLNPYRAIGNIANINFFSPNHVARQHPEWLIANNAERILDPGIPEVRQHINDVVMDIVNRYDVDGIHFDDYFYPNAAFNDDATFAAYNRGFTIRADWRRDNINLLIQAVSLSIKAAKPWVEFGVSPSGIWRNGGEGSATSGLQHYVSLFADSRKWLQEGWIDYLCPQVYWYIGQPGADYGVLIPWWNNNAFNRLIYIGMAGYKVGDAAQGVSWSQNRSMIPNEIRMNRSSTYPNVHGQSIYNTTSLVNNRLNFRDSIRDHFYNVPALQPRMPWIDQEPPMPVTNLQASYQNGTVNLQWTNPDPVENELDKVRQLVIYRSETPGIDTSNAHNIRAITPTQVSSFVDQQVDAGKTYYYLVTTLDRLHNESNVSNVTAVCTFDDTMAPQITSCTHSVTFCQSLEELYTIPQVQAEDNCVNLEYSFVISGATSRSGNGNDASGHFEPGTSVITWTVADGSGNSTQCQTTVVVNANPVVTIPDAYALPSGVLPNTIYTGYTPASSLNLSATVTGQSPFNYEWSEGSTNATITVSPVSATTYTLTVTDANGCASTVSTDIAVVNVGGNQTHKVLVCHNGSTLDISGNGNAVAAHLAHGDMLGACDAGLITNSSVVERVLGTAHISVMPNPSNLHFNIRIEGNNQSERIDLRVMDILGRVVEQRTGLQHNQTIRIGDSYKAGIYFVELNNGRDKTVLKLIRQ